MLIYLLIYNQSTIFSSLNSNIIIDSCKFMDCIIYSNGICIIDNNSYNISIISTFYYNIKSGSQICCIYGIVENSNLKGLCFYRCSSSHLVSTWITGINYFSLKKNGSITESSFILNGIDSNTHILMSYYGSTNWNSINVSNSKSTFSSSWCSGLVLGNSEYNSINYLLFFNNTGGYLLLFSSIYYTTITKSVIFIENTMIDGLIICSSSAFMENLIIYNCSQNIFLTYNSQILKISNLLIDLDNYYITNFEYTKKLILIKFPYKYYFNLIDIYLCLGYNNKYSISRSFNLKKLILLLSLLY